MGTREKIAEQWLRCVLGTYPSQSAAFFAGEPDLFRNPAGRTFRLCIVILLDELLGDMDSARVDAALDSILRIRAVEDCQASQALEFLFQLKPILRQHEPGPSPGQLDSRIDELALKAFDLYMQHRERTFAVRTNEARRRLYVLERLLEKVE